MTEQQIQAAVVAHLNKLALPDVIFVHVNNNPRSAKDGARLKRMGLKKGAPDLLLWRGAYSYSLELKTQKGAIKPEQWDFHDRFASEPTRFAFIARGLDQALKALNGWGLIRGSSQ